MTTNLAYEYQKEEIISILKKCECQTLDSIINYPYIYPYNQW